MIVRHLRHAYVRTFVRYILVRILHRLTYAPASLTLPRSSVLCARFHRHCIKLYVYGVIRCTLYQAIPVRHPSSQRIQCNSFDSYFSKINSLCADCAITRPVVFYTFRSSGSRSARPCSLTDPGQHQFPRLPELHYLLRGLRAHRPSLPRSCCGALRCCKHKQSFTWARALVRAGTSCRPTPASTQQDDLSLYALGVQQGRQGMSG